MITSNHTLHTIISHFRTCELNIMDDSPRDSTSKAHAGQNANSSTIVLGKLWKKSATNAKPATHVKLTRKGRQLYLDHFESTN